MKTKCIICDADILLPEDIVESEVLSCVECKSRLVVESLKDNHVVLAKAPQVEEDWGE